MIGWRNPNSRIDASMASTSSSLRLDTGDAGEVVDFASGSDADAADLGPEGVGEVIAIEVHGGDDVEFVGPREHLLEHDAGHFYSSLEPRYAPFPDR
jgi:hypothetical protein